MQALYRAVTCFTQVTICTESFDGNAIYRADPSTFVTTDAVLGLHVEPVTARIGNRNTSGGVLDGDRSLVLFEIPWVFDPQWFIGPESFFQVLPGQTHSLRDRFGRVSDLTEVVSFLAHGT